MTNAAIPAEKTLLLVDDDKPFLTRLARAMETRGFEVLVAESVAEGVAHVADVAAGLGDGYAEFLHERIHGVAVGGECEELCLGKIPSPADGIFGGLQVEYFVATIPGGQDFHLAAAREAFAHGDLLAFGRGEGCGGGGGEHGI